MFGELLTHKQLSWDRFARWIKGAVIFDQSQWGGTKDLGSIIIVIYYEYYGFSVPSKEKVIESIKMNFNETLTVRCGKIW